MNTALDLMAPLPGIIEPRWWKGSPILSADTYTIDCAGMPTEWRTGDIAVVCNYRFAHGRPSVYLDEGEERELGVLMGEAYDRVEALENK